MRAAALACALLLAACSEGAPSADAVQAQAITPSDLPAYFDCLRVSAGTVVSAHRGGPAPGYAENALRTMENTLARAPAFLEIDIARTRDGALVLMHDDTVDRTTNGQGALSAMTLAQFQALRLRDDDGAVLNEQPPTLSEALDWADGRAVLELDVKQGVSYEDVVEAVQEADAMHRVIFITYSFSGAIRIARLAPEAMIYTTLQSEEELDLMQRAGVDLSRIVAWLGAEELDVDLLNRLNERGVEGRFGAFGWRPNYVELAMAGVESVASDEPVNAYRAFDAADAREGSPALQCAARH